jgi:NHL repeat
MSQHRSPTLPTSLPDAGAGIRSFFSRGSAVGVVLVFLLVMAAAAQGAQTHAFEESFGTAGSGAGQLSLATAVGGSNGIEPLPGSGVAVDDATGDVYVADTGNNRVDEFDPSMPPGEQFLRAWGWGVVDGAAELQVCSTSCRVGLTGNEPGELTEPVFVAVDNAAGGEGDVYVAGAGENSESPANAVQKFGPAGALVTGWGSGGRLDGSTAPDGPFGGPSGISVDASGNLWVYVGGTAHAINNHVYEFERGGGFLQSWEPPSTGGYSPQGLAVGRGGSVDTPVNATSLLQYTSAGSKLGIVYESPTIRQITGVGLDAATGDLFVDEATSIRDISGRCMPSNETNATGCQPIQTFGADHLSDAAGLAVASDGTVYAANAGTDQIAVFDVSLEATSSAATDLHGTTATVNGSVDPKTGGKVTRCFFRVGLTTSYGENVPCLDSGGVEVGTELSPIEAPTQVHADLEGLEGGSSYHFTLRAFNLAEEEVTSEDASFETLPLPVITATESSEVTATSAALEARIDPEGLAVTNCQIQWGTSTSYGNGIPCDPATLPAGTTALPVTAKLEGLSANTTYHWRVLATDANGTAVGADNTFVFSTGSPGSPAGSCPDEALRQANGSLALPDCRAYELVTPPQKNGALLAPIIFGVTPSLAADGSRLIVSSLQCFAGAQSCTGDRVSKGPPFEFERTPSGWVTRPLAPSASGFPVNTVWGYDAGSGQVLYSSPLASGITDEFYARLPGGAMDGVGPIAEHERYFVIGGAGQAATGDLSDLVYESSHENLWPSFDLTQANSASLYEYAGTASEPLLVGVTGGPGSKSLIGVCGTRFATPSEAAKSLSADGRIVYFQALPCSSGSGTNEGVKVPVDELYARVDGGGPGAETALISGRSLASCQEASCLNSAPRDAALQATSADGSVAVFASTQKLMDSATEDPLASDSARSNGCARNDEHAIVGPNGCNLYLYDFARPAGDRLVDVSAGDTSGLGPEVQGVMALSEDGSEVYFVARGVLAGPNSAGQGPIEGGDNLYLYRLDPGPSEARTTFIATLPGEVGPTGGGGETGQWSGTAEGASLSQNGQVLVFTSHGALTPDASGREGPAQVYRYEAGTGALQRISIGLAGFNDDGNAGIGDARLALAESTDLGRLPGHPTMSADGTKVFFTSPVGLTPQALNDVPFNGRGGLAQNVYEWETDGSGGCTRPEGCISLITDGKDAAEGGGGNAYSLGNAVELLGTDDSGEDVFFSTVDPLVPADTDTGYDIYDARAGGGFAPAPAPTACQGDACKGEGSQATAEGGAATSTFSGAEEGPKHQGAAKCKKGGSAARASNQNLTLLAPRARRDPFTFVRKGSKCVKTQQDKKKHHSKKKAHKGSRRDASQIHGGKK